MGYTTNIQPQLDNFAPHAYKCAFIGYNPKQKAYKVYDIENRRILVSRYVTFYENQFSYQNNLTTDKLVPLPCILVDDEVQKRFLSETSIAAPEN